MLKAHLISIVNVTILNIPAKPDVTLILIISEYVVTYHPFRLSHQGMLGIHFNGIRSVTIQFYMSPFPTPLLQYVELHVNIIRIIALHISDPKNH